MAQAPHNGGDASTGQLNDAAEVTIASHSASVRSGDAVALLSRLRRRVIWSLTGATTRARRAPRRCRASAA
jgi:hypothetical protein